MGLGCVWLLRYSSILNLFSILNPAYFSLYARVNSVHLHFAIVVALVSLLLGWECRVFWECLLVQIDPGLIIVRSTLNQEFFSSTNRKHSQNRQHRRATFIKVTFSQQNHILRWDSLMTMWSKSTNRQAHNCNCRHLTLVTVWFMEATTDMGNGCTV